MEIGIETKDLPFVGTRTVTGEQFVANVTVLTHVMMIRPQNRRGVSLFMMFFSFGFNIRGDRDVNKGFTVREDTNGGKAGEETRTAAKNQERRYSFAKVTVLIRFMMIRPQNRQGVSLFMMFYSFGFTIREDTNGGIASLTLYSFGLKNYSMELGKIYFFTATIHQWLPLLKDKIHLELILSSLSFLTKKGLIKVYGFVIMPNHIHLIWEMLEINGKEMPHASFLKFTSHGFLKNLRSTNGYFLEKFKVDQDNKYYEFWKRDSLSIELFTPKVVYQKLDYIHNNPCRKKWMLSESPLDYPYSSSKFYETGEDHFGFLSHIGEQL